MAQAWTEMPKNVCSKGARRIPYAAPISTVTFLRAPQHTHSVIMQWLWLTRRAETVVRIAALRIRAKPQKKRRAHSGISQRTSRFVWLDPEPFARFVPCANRQFVLRSPKHAFATRGFIASLYRRHT